MKKIKYQTKFLLYHTGIIMLIIFCLLSYFYVVIVGKMKNQESADYKVIAEKTAMQLDNLYFDMDRMALQVAANPAVVDAFKQIKPDKKSNYFIKNPLKSAEIKRLLESYNFKNNGHLRICLYNNDNDFVCTATGAVTEAGIKEHFKSKDFKKIKKFFKNEDNFIYYKRPSEDILSLESGYQEGAYISVVREIKDYYSNSLQCGYVEVQESMSKIDSILSNLGDDISVELVEKGKGVIYSHVEDNFPDEKSRELVISMNSAPYELHFYKSPESFNRAVRQLYVALALTLLIVMIVAVFLEKFLEEKINKPLFDLNRSLKSVNMDNMQVEIADEDSQDIVLQLEDSFNSMLAKIDHSMKKQIVAETNEVKAQFFALQSQMNPHFLHNILAIISVEAQMYGDRKIPDICRKLGEILRYNSHMGDGFSTIEKECEMAVNYMELMKVRYEDLFQYNVELSEISREVRVPKLIIQPLCENCFKHGFKNKEPVWKINIRAYVEKDRWFISVKDNGSGFSPEFIESFEEQKEYINNEEFKSVLENISIGGLCIPNIYARMKISYGNNFTFRLYNDSSETCVLIGGTIND